MIDTLDDAWNWYQAVRQVVRVVERFAGHYWDGESRERTLDDVLHRDNLFRELESSQILQLAERVSTDLDDLAVLLLFSVFEATVRDRTLDGIDQELPSPPRNLVLRKSFEAAVDSVRHGSIKRLTDSYKSLNSDAKTLVDQVRQYRNWVAHGRRGEPTNNVDPESARTRLDRFLTLLDADSRSAQSVLPALIDLPTQPPKPPESPSTTP